MGNSVGHEPAPPTSRAGSIPCVHKLELVSSHRVTTGDRISVGCGARHSKHRTQNSHQLNPLAMNWPSVCFLAESREDQRIGVIISQTSLEWLGVIWLFLLAVFLLISYDLVCCRYRSVRSAAE